MTDCRARLLHCVAWPGACRHRRSCLTISIFWRREEGRRRRCRFAGVLDTLVSPFGSYDFHLLRNLFLIVLAISDSDGLQVLSVRATLHWDRLQVMTVFAFLILMTMELP